MTESSTIVVHCFAEWLPDGQWQAFSIQFGLAAQGDSLKEAREKLFAMVDDYLMEAIGEDRQYRDQLLSRKAPLKIRAKYVWLRFLGYLGRQGRLGTLFDEPFSNYAHC